MGNSGCAVGARAPESTDFSRTGAAGVWETLRGRKCWQSGSDDTGLLDVYFRNRGRQPCRIRRLVRSLRRPHARAQNPVERDLLLIRTLRSTRALCRKSRRSFAEVEPLNNHREKLSHLYSTSGTNTIGQPIDSEPNFDSLVQRVIPALGRGDAVEQTSVVARIRL